MRSAPPAAMQLLHKAKPTVQPSDDCLPNRRPYFGLLSSGRHT